MAPKGLTAQPAEAQTVRLLSVLTPHLFPKKARTPCPQSAEGGCAPWAKTANTRC